MSFVACSDVVLIGIYRLPWQQVVHSCPHLALTTLQRPSDCVPTFQTMEIASNILFSSKIQHILLTPRAELLPPLSVNPSVWVRACDILPFGLQGYHKTELGSKHYNEAK
ncbi:hypothetical protein J6590_052379 [Homalodisca vitripennis]|nr:hypothetical protein J6590_052379 [Homalodisca vitripennis]